MLFKKNTMMTQTICNHTYCFDCLIRSLNTIFKCSYCRGPLELSETEIIQNILD